MEYLQNFEYSKQSKSKMFWMYKKENEHFISQLYDAQYEEMFEYLRAIANNNEL